jgi:hypothetical protein
MKDGNVEQKETQNNAMTCCNKTQYLPLLLLWALVLSPPLRCVRCETTHTPHRFVLLRGGEPLRTSTLMD